MSKHIKGMGFYLVIFAVIMAAIYLTDTMSENKADEYTYAQFIKDVKGTVNKSKNVTKIKRVEIAQNEEVPTGYIVVYFQDKDKQAQKLDVTDTSKVEDEIRELGFESLYVAPIDTSFDLTELLPWLLVGLVAILLVTMLTTRASTGAGGGNSKVMNFGKSRAKLSTDASEYSFEKVAGLKEEKEELEEIVDFLKEPQKYIEVGARIPNLHEHEHA